eukprot:c13048_g1_i1.p1 GENE.c13048_g1_i1~~c13048_g1_i1.p1  ORF type:complete len:194 (-),score=40.43 c13048_g1_i1:42-623(-)
MGTRQLQVEMSVAQQALVIGCGSGLFAGGIWFGVSMAKRKFLSEMGPVKEKAEVVQHTSQGGASPRDLQLQRIAQLQKNRVVQQRQLRELADPEAVTIAMKALGYGTVLAFVGVGGLVIGVMVALQVKTLEEFQQAMQTRVVPKWTRCFKVLVPKSDKFFQEESIPELESIFEKTETSSNPSLPSNTPSLPPQ